jgi:hypothetical protein
MYTHWDAHASGVITIRNVDLSANSKYVDWT